MSDDDFLADLADLDPSDLASIEAWSRKHRTAGFHRPREEPAPQPKREQKLTDAEVAQANTRVWQQYVDERALHIVKTFVGEIVHHERARVRKQIEAAIERRPKVIIMDPNDALKKQITEFSSGLREELAEIRRALDLPKRGEVLDLPALPRKRA